MVTPCGRRGAYFAQHERASSRPTDFFRFIVEGLVKLILDNRWAPAFLMSVAWIVNWLKYGLALAFGDNKRCK
jgi:hypothetical protein